MSLAEVKAPPYEVSETGWGSFEIGIAIHLRDPSLTPIHFIHILKLFPDSGAASSGPDKPTLSEFYDEIVFNEPPKDAALAAALARGPVSDCPAYMYQDHFGLYSPDQDLAAIKAARDFLRERAEEHQDRLSQRMAEASALKKHLASLGML